MVLFLRLNFWPCPRCGDSFFLKYAMLTAGGKECPHCHLPYLADPRTTPPAPIIPR
jgi:ribosomal protein S27AE